MPEVSEGHDVLVWMSRVFVRINMLSVSLDEQGVSRNKQAGSLDKQVVRLNK